MASNSIFNAQKVINDVLAQRIDQRYNKPAQTGGKGLLDFIGSEYAGDLATGLLAQSGYSPMPTNLGSSVGKAMQFADRQKMSRDAKELAELATLGNVSKALYRKPDKKTDFRFKLDEYNRISGIPEEQRTGDDKRTLGVLEKSLKGDTQLNDYKVYLAEKIKNGDELSETDLALKNFLVKTDPFASLFENVFNENVQSDSPDSEPSWIDKTIKKVFDGDDSQKATSEIEKMNNMKSEKEAKEYFESLPKDLQEAIKKQYNK
tara:strand:+ start:177 stop:962 length:786 start_codon:yes stop_codon:yes gene_type:complete